ncbi:rhodanese-like domain-containing protein [Novosphingobium sp. MBES04]|uniref:rhodanese-like domain-containing protein n=1 Tax=Novosphingobium sp. MBES04 TaxID=1206458 RepID=UPI00072372FF|nr:rhodanese-like domain-containing protein [Novosphingobium sp. MBES04]GAM04960.1 rhodanese-like protein [Novosphingobium sp. MBES04]
MALGALAPALLTLACAPLPGRPSPERALSEEDLFDAEGYRTARFRAPVARDPAPARRMAEAEVLALQPGRDALFLDVLPVTGGWRDPATGRWHLSEPHRSVPGALWHPETGRSPPDARLWEALRGAIAEARRANAHLPVIVFCRSDCWMSWNVARRLAREGVGQVYWYEEGVEGWHAAGRDLVEVTPLTVPP